MALEKITEVVGTGVPVMGDDIDTDRIIPARFMKCVTFDGLGEFAFFDVRFNEADGSPKDHPLNEERFAKASILVSGENFGCGSSREHAPQSLYRYGFRGILAQSFAEIFFGNSITLGMPCMTLPRKDLDEIAATLKADATTEIRLDVPNRKVFVGEKEYDAQIPETAREGLIEGRWDPIAELLESSEQVDQVAGSLHYV
ncbi:3-isopropylmalate dehydratase small subunit [Puniceicoccus vermicola]|uniref:3-isopropylmalate dehydratase n=1 Tax=Puniceicoccus vermicola TaxID=388746 RepID=A0A7X1B443_9BACT|nr:3-isopropylmalate dehydratase small subunit [Puniceicoccus vermicola]MBC2604050.1 3-isopropylmalate dehydratase small subunit [Puniceicoccus vermicola]